MMAANTAPIFVAVANIAHVKFQNADGTTPKDLITSGADGTKVTRIPCVSDDTATVNMQLFLHHIATAISYQLGTQPIPTLSGTNGAAATVNLLGSMNTAWLDSKGEFFLPTGYKLQVAPKVAVTVAKTVTVVCLAADY